MPEPTPQLPGWPKGLQLDLAAPYVGVSKSLFLRWVKDGVAPQPLLLPARVTVWVRDDLDRFLLDRRKNAAIASEQVDEWND